MLSIAVFVVIAFCLKDVQCVCNMDGDMMGMKWMGGSPHFESIMSALPEIYLDNEFSSLMDAILAANLADNFSDPHLAVTFFAPNNDAFADFVSEELSNDKDSLSTVLEYHVVPTMLTTTSLMQRTQLDTLGGGCLNISMSENSFVVFGEESSANVVLADVIVGSSVIHVIDNILLPTML
eukprot:TRINITY_DN4096_c0_g2_i2.p1 TRINITY_DN4096_c0_g2~~TRINITY_DN4096_c0_g2_i2.p1  ORF type:complete len:180 (+),score=43.44 TRINITY_DN4096_c0_g2_i2:128-667(+)